jgi:hypothetical protein
VGATEGEAAVTEGNPFPAAAARHDGSRQLASYTVDLLDLGPKPESHLDRSLDGPWQRYELVARNLEGDELACVRGTGKADCWYRLAGELRRSMGPTR